MLRALRALNPPVVSYFYDRFRLPCGGVCLDADAVPSAPAGGNSRSHAPDTTKTNSDARGNSPKDSANGGDADTSREPSSEDGGGDETEDDVDCRNGWGALTQPRRALRKRGRAPRESREGSEHADSPATRGDGAGDGVGRAGGKDEYFPVNAAALRTSIDNAVPDSVMCAYRRLPSLTRLVHNPGGSAGQVESGLFCESRALRGATVQWGVGSFGGVGVYLDFFSLQTKYSVRRALPCLSLRIASLA